MTFNGVMAVTLRYFAEFGSFRGPLRESGYKLYRYFMWQKCSPKNLLFSDIAIGDVCSDHPLRGR